MTRTGGLPGRRDESQRRATIKDVAEAAGVSRSTASRALTGSGYVGLGVRERVQTAADALGYVPDDMARHLKQRVSRSVGVLVPDLRNPFFADVAAGISQGARRRGFAMILADGDGTAAGEVEAARRFVALRVAGVLVAPLSERVTGFLGGQRVPVVQVDRHVDGAPMDAVMFDNLAAAREVTEHLIGLGHRRIALVVDDSGGSTTRDRRRGHLDACRSAGLPVDDALVLTCPPDAGATRDRVRALLAGPEAPTAVFAAGVLLAEGAWRAASDLGLRVPRDLSLAAYDDAAWMSLVTPGVTAVRQDAVALGEAALDRLLDRLETPGAPEVTALAAEVRYRGSTAPPRPDGVVAEPLSHMGVNPGQQVR